MGNPLSPILADIVLEKLFNDKLPLLDQQPTFIYKYVDDIILATVESNIGNIQNLFNSFHEKLKFTVEKENNNSLTFLDLKLYRHNNKISTEWHKKDISSDTILNYLSNHPYKMKRNVAQAFIRRALNLTDIQFRQNIIYKIINILKMNNYPIKLINKLMTKILFTYKNKKTIIRNDVKYGTLPYISKLTEKISSTLQNNTDNLIIANKIINKSSVTYSQTKDKIPNELKDGLIYKIACKNCDSCYIGETSKTKSQRIKQHERDVSHITRQHISQRTNFRTALVKHTVENNHEFDFENAITLDYENKKDKRLFKEACHIWLSKNPINYKVDTKKLHSSYINIIKNCS